ncbi:MAG: ABC transporter substrate-binding protein [Proteobacteria bacterium]|nr:ABC transporter substrate-binding protein [Pseudomonadota bacterium]
MTGDYADLGKDAQRGMQIAVDAVNENTSLLSRPLKLVIEDNGSSAKGSVSAIEILINRDKVPAILGPLASSTTLAVAPIAEENKVVLVSPTASSPKLTNAGDYIFRTAASDLLEATTMAEFARYELELAEVAILYINNDYGIGLADSFESKFELIGGTVPVKEAFPESGTDFRSHLLKVITAKPDALYMPGYAQQMGRILIQAKELGFKTTFLSSIDFENPKLIEIAGNEANGVIYTAYSYDSTSEKKQIQDFVRRFTMQYGEVPNIYSALSFDATTILAKAIGQVSGLNSHEIKTALYRIDGFEGVTGSFAFDEHGDVRHGIVMKTVRDGKFLYYDLT